MTAPSTRLGQALADRYRIDHELGAGGMATVYLAHDLRHDRKVAIKVLHPELAAVIGADRFLSEIHTTANLQHPHILPLFDSGAVPGGEAGTGDGAPRLLYYVMPYIPGESLRQRLTRERQLPVADAVRTSQEVASALDYAHRQGVVHRDIKPENILLHDGSALVADFGIALAITAAGGGRLTQTGLSLGTPAYMSPEQAMGERDIGPRSDVYALGAVTYEMLCGEPPFTGPSSQAIVARTLTEAPRPLRTERKSIPPHVEAAVLTALEKLPADRFGSAREYAEALRKGEGGEGGASSASSRHQAATVAMGVSHRGARRFLVPGLAALSALSAFSALYLLATRARGTGPAATPVEFAPVEMGSMQYFSVSPDGQTIVGTVPDSNGILRVLLRRLDNTTPTAVAGTENVTRAWMTPDNSGIVVRTVGGRLRFVPLTSGVARDLGPAEGYVTVEWGPGDSLLTVVENTLFMIPLDGGPRRTVATRTGPGTFFIPRMLPGGREILVGHRITEDSVNLFQMDLATGASELVSPNVQEVRPFPDGRVLWLDGTSRVLYGTYDPRARAFGSRQVVLADGVDDLFAHGNVLVLRPSVSRRDLWVLNAGARSPVQLVTGDTIAAAPVFSPDGTHLALVLVPDANQANDADLWVLDRKSGLRHAVAGRVAEYAWFPDGRQLVVFRRRGRQGAQDIFVVPADGSAPARQVTADTVLKRQPAVTADGSGVVYAIRGRIAMQPFAPEAPARALFDDPGQEFDPAFSPDGRWLLYGVEDERGGFLYVRAWPSLGPRIAIGAVGLCPSWWGDSGRRIYSCLPDGTVAWTSFDPATGRTVGSPQPVGAIAQRNVWFTVNTTGADLAWISSTERYATEPRVLANWRADAERRLSGR